MGDDGRQRHRLRDGGVELVVETWFDGRNRARLLIDGVEVDAGDADEIDQIELDAGNDWQVRVAWWSKGRVARCVLVEARAGVEGDAPRRVREVLTPFEPPPGTRAHRRYQWAEAHPNLYAARHVVLKVGGTIAAVLGLGALLQALLTALLPRIDLDWLPDIDPPDWLRYLDPAYWLRPVIERLGDAVAWLFGWLPDVDLPDLGWLRYAGGILFAIIIAVEEARRRKARQRRAQEDQAEGPEQDRARLDDGDSPSGS